MNIELILSQTLDVSLLWTNPCRKFSKFDGKVLKFMSEINEGVGGTSAKVAQHAREEQITLPRCTVSILSKCSFIFVQVLSQPYLRHKFGEPQ
jgi:hypothetical protein